MANFFCHTSPICLILLHFYITQALQKLFAGLVAVLEELVNLAEIQFPQIPHLDGNTIRAQMHVVKRTEVGIDSKGP